MACGSLAPGRRYALRSYAKRAICQALRPRRSSATLPCNSSVFRTDVCIPAFTPLSAMEPFSKNSRASRLLLHNDVAGNNSTSDKPSGSRSEMSCCVEGASANASSNSA